MHSCVYTYTYNCTLSTFTHGLSMLFFPIFNQYIYIYIYIYIYVYMNEFQEWMTVTMTVNVIFTLFIAFPMKGNHHRWHKRTHPSAYLNSGQTPSPVSLVSVTCCSSNTGNPRVLWATRPTQVLWTPGWLGAKGLPYVHSQTSILAHLHTLINVLFSKVRSKTILDWSHPSLLQLEPFGYERYDTTWQNTNICILVQYVSEVIQWLHRS